MRTVTDSMAHPGNRLATLAVAGALALSGAIFTSAVATAQDADISTVTGDLGTFLVDADGNTLYYFTPDPTGASVCSGECIDAWPVVGAPEDADPSGDESVTGTLGTITRDDGSRHATYRGRPLYYFAGDAAAGDTKGHTLSDVWWVAAEDGTLPTTPVIEEPELLLEAATTDLGTFIVGADGLTTYYFSIDTTPGLSLCSDDCLAAWPPVTVSDGVSVAAGEGIPGVLGVITGTDGSPQVTYDGHPLYYFAGDAEAGQTEGQAVGDVWWVATVDGILPR